MPVLAAGMSLGVCPDAQAVEFQVQEIQANFQQIYSIAKKLEICLDDLAEIVSECSSENWDGYDAAALDAGAVSNAHRFITALPGDFPYPEIGAMPDGDISLDWDFGPRRTLTVSIGSQARLAYAAINNDEEWSGTVTFIETVPNTLLRAISVICSKPLEKV
jgi:hypothetical protein